MNFPVLVTLKDDSGYVFQYPIPVTLHNNEPYKEMYGYDMFTTTYFDRGFCDDLGFDLTEIKVYGKEEGYSNIELNDVNISMECFKYRCPLGQTEKSSHYPSRPRRPQTRVRRFWIATATRNEAAGCSKKKPRKPGLSQRRIRPGFRRGGRHAGKISV